MTTGKHNSSTTKTIIMKELQIKFSFQYFAMILLFSEVKSKKICKFGKDDTASQLFHVNVRGKSLFQKTIL